MSYTTELNELDLDSQKANKLFDFTNPRSIIVRLIQFVRNKISPSTGLTFTGEFDLTQSYETYYNQYSSNVELTPTIKSNPLVGAGARVVINAGSSATLVATNLGTKRVGSDDYTVSKLNEISVYNLPEGLTYSIKVLN